MAISMTQIKERINPKEALGQCKPHSLLLTPLILNHIKSFYTLVERGTRTRWKT
jgi:hypothetical protein